MKFDMHLYWKHEECVDVFISVNHVVFDDDGRNSILRGHWCTQTPNHWFFTIQDRIKITDEQYSKWHRYEPKGEIRL